MPRVKSRLTRAELLEKVTFQRYWYEPQRVLIIARHGALVKNREISLFWVEIFDFEKGVFSGKVLSSPGKGYPWIAIGSTVFFVAPEGWEYPVMVSERYSEEIELWNVGPCDKCGSVQLLDSPSELLLLQYPATRLETPPVMFEAFCYLCGGKQILTIKAVSRQ